MIHQSILYQEIHEQPQIVARFLTEALQEIFELAAQIQARKISHVIIAARGTSDNAARYAQYVLGAFNQLPVMLATPSLVSIYHTPPHFTNALVLGISQSGQSPDIVAVLAEARRQGALTAAITNATGSPLAQQGDFVVDLRAGKELAVAATKSYTAELAAIALLSVLLSEDESRLQCLQEIPDAMRKTLALNETIARLALRYRYMNNCVVIGRGFNYATAFEIGLKMKELTYSIVEPYSSADFLHGPLAMLEPGFPIFLIAPQGKLSGELRIFLNTVLDRRAEVLAISDDPGILELAQLTARLPHPVPEWLSPLTAIIPGQMLAMHLAAIRGHDVDAPRGIQKVTETK